jgi:DNA-binding transcriptional LysR family regulator
MFPTNLPTDLLRTFITVTDLGGYTKAGEVLNRTQPAISLQMKRLEELLGEKLLVHDGRTINLTSSGKVLAGFARQILRLNDEAVARFRGTRVDGPLRIGLPTDYALFFLQSEVTRFAHDNDAVNLEIHCDVSRKLLEDVHSDRLDIAVALIGEADDQYLVRAWEEQPVWVCARDAATHAARPLPLVTHPEGCEYRDRIVEALNRDGLAWRIAYSSPGITGLQNAVSSGLGVSALTRKTLHDDMRILSDEDGLPPLEKLRIGLFYKHPRQSSAGLKLVEHLVANLDEAADGDFMPSAHPRG